MIKSSFRFLLLPGMDREGGYEEEIDEENVRIFRKRDDKVFFNFSLFFFLFFTSTHYQYNLKGFSSSSFTTLFITQRQVILRILLLFQKLLLTLRVDAIELRKSFFFSLAF